MVLFYQYEEELSKLKNINPREVSFAERNYDIFN